MLENKKAMWIVIIVFIAVGSSIFLYNVVFLKTFNANAQNSEVKVKVDESRGAILLPASHQKIMVTPNESKNNSLKASVNNGSIDFESSSAHEEDTPQKLLYKSSNIQETFDSLVKNYDMDDISVRNALDRVVFFCAKAYDSSGYIRHQGIYETTKSWAYLEMLTLCEGFDVKKTQKLLAQYEFPEEDIRDFYHDVQERPLEILTKSDDPSSIVQALSKLVDSDTTFQTMDFVKKIRENLSTSAQIQAYENSAMLTICTEIGDCGANTIPTLMVCMQHGCREGSTYQEALQQTLPPREYEATMAFYNWIMQQRGGNR